MTAILRLPLERNAVISACGRYRYLLTRRVGPGTRAVTFIMLNPSTADATRDDPTIRRCIGFARSWGIGGVDVVNLFAFRATEPRDGGSPGLSSHRRSAVGRDGRAPR